MDADWMIDVLADLKKFARHNQFLELAEQLDDTMMVAATEIRRNKVRDVCRARGHEGKTGDAH
ncbi:hypothetical protein AB0T83_03275 [Fluviibacterium sp. DFM31]|uniref:Uncharacterized protein n=1 Tax=Meridianimarinicoccus marinus TaxID=3231483 RepID=A0ABV3L2L7_9RHOB